ncbi:MAG TPA: hypothetical protein VM327_02810 [Candidatus Thermoplasmatota archaeon]|nr:hypothetical protein [Candidatus Thermoplasmatota archaeon]
MNRTLLTIAVLALAATIAIPTASAARAEIQISTTTNPSTSTPGTTGSFVFALKNVGDTTAYSIDIDVDELDDGIYINNTQSAHLGGLGQGSSTTSSPFTFEVGQSTPPGFYHVTFQLDYGYNDGTNSQWGGSTFTATIAVKDSAGLGIGPITPDQLSPGATTSALLNVTNLGTSSMSSVQGSWNSAEDAVLPLGGSNTFYIASLGAGETTQVPMRVAASTSVDPGVYSLDYRVSYDDATGARRVQNFTLGVRIGGGTDFDVSAADGSTGGLNVNVANIGVNTASGVLIEVLQAAGAAQASSSSFLGDINAGDFTVATLAAAPGGAGRASTEAPSAGGAGSQVFLRISYTDTAGQRQTVEKQMAMPAGGLSAGGPPAGGNFAGGPGQSTPWYESPYVIGVLVLVIAAAGGYVWYKRKSKSKYAKIEVADKPAPGSMMWPTEQAAPADGPAEWSESTPPAPPKAE